MTKTVVLVRDLPYIIAVSSRPVAWILPGQSDGVVSSFRVPSSGKAGNARSIAAETKVLAGSPVPFHSAAHGSVQLVNEGRCMRENGLSHGDCWRSEQSQGQESET